MIIYESSFPIPSREPVFQGHFPGNPVFPGVLTLAFVRETLRRGTGRDWRLDRVVRHKLLRPLVPGDLVHLRCRAAQDTGRTLSLDCRLDLTDGTRVAQARLRMEQI